MKKTAILLMASWLLAGSTAYLRADQREPNRGTFSDRHAYSRGDIRRDSREYRSERSIRREIRSNEKRIRSIERRLDKLLRRDSPRFDSGRNGYDRPGRYGRFNRHEEEIRRLEMERAELLRRNEHLRRYLYR
jgi:hypothetical protein